MSSSYFTSILSIGASVYFNRKAVEFEEESCPYVEITDNYGDWFILPEEAEYVDIEADVSTAERIKLWKIENYIYSNDIYAVFIPCEVYDKLYNRADFFRKFYCINDAGVFVFRTKLPEDRFAVAFRQFGKCYLGLFKLTESNICQTSN